MYNVKKGNNWNASIRKEDTVVTVEYWHLQKAAIIALSLFM